MRHEQLNARLGADAWLDDGGTYDQETVTSSLCPRARSPPRPSRPQNPHDRTIDRQRTPENPTSAARKTAARIAWERILTARIHNLATEHEQLQVLAERYKPPGVRLDLDLILADNTKGTVWIIDAKNANPTNDQLNKMQAQIRLLQKAPDLTDGRSITGVIVHRKRQLDTPIQPTEYHNTLRCTLQRLPDLLLARHLPGKRPAQLKHHAQR